MKQHGWPQSLVDVIAKEVRRHRERLDISAQKLADRCAELGYPIARNTLSNLENGRREAVNVAELLVLAAALDLPPLQLLMPAGYRERIEVLPGREVHPYDAVLWARGLEPLPGLDSDRGQFLEWLYLFEEHEHVVTDLVHLPSRVRHPAQSEEERQSLYRYGDRLIQTLLQLRGELREDGRTPPPLPEELQHIEQQSDRRVRRQLTEEPGEGAP